MALMDCLLTGCALPLQNHPGKGVTAQIPDANSKDPSHMQPKGSKQQQHSSSSSSLSVAIGNRLLLQEQGVQLLPEVEEFMQSREGMGQTCVLVGVNGKAVAALAVADPLKPEAAGVVAALQQQVRYRGLSCVVDGKRCCL
eukprot:GHUV01010436.1.p4 GENE.GHUV01010436.1~~GHUV01010436.1.p4  ORF type:complete len:141 (+),score=67.69 GHUV01010436.1:421-843(+)